MLRILHFTHIINRYDVVDAILSRLDRSRFELSVLTGLPPRRTAPYTTGEAYANRLLGFEFNRANYAKMFSVLVKEIRRFRPHILQAHHFDENIIASLAVRVAQVPCYVISRHYSDHIYYLTKGLKRRAVLAIEGWCNRAADYILVPTDDVAEILTYRQGVPPEKVKVLPFGIDFRAYRTTSAEAPDKLRCDFGLKGKYMILACCRLSPEKGLDDLLRGIAEVRRDNDHFKLMIVGTGPCEAVLRRLSHELGVEDCVVFVGPRNDALDWFAAADLMVQPSYCESFCQVLIEALAFGKPVIMTPVGVAPAVIGENERGRLVEKGDSRAIASSIREMMDDRDLGRRLGAMGQAFIRERMSAETATHACEEFYESALDSSVETGPGRSGWGGP